MSLQDHSIFEKSWCLKEFPENEKKVNITIIFKTGKKEDLQNYSLSDSPQSLGRWWAKNPGNHFETHEGQQGDFE